jgi:hypothetical protein
MSTLSTSKIAFATAILVVAPSARGWAAGNDAAAAADAPERRALPAHIEAGLLFVDPVAPGGQRVRFLVDSGGGYFLLAERAVAVGLTQGPAKSDRIPFPQWKADASIPAPASGLLPVWRPGDNNPVPPMDGILGADWLSGREWEIDYPQGHFSQLTGWQPSAQEKASAIPLHFQKEKDGELTTGFPRLQVVIDGEELSLLFDTGAQVQLSPAATQALADGGPALRATSFIAASIFDRWRKAHPQWRVVEKADANMNGEPMILVDSVGVGSCTVGPVWFTRRPDRNFTEHMSQWMDAKIMGALGGSALSAFRVSLSYPKEIAVLHPAAADSGSTVKAHCESH